MATTTHWTGNTSIDWANPLNWDNGAPINNTFDAVIGSTVTLPVINGNYTIASLTINGTDMLTIGDAGSGISAGLAAASITIGGGGLIVGEGTLTGPISVVGTATIGQNTVNAQPTPQFTIAGPISDPGGKLTLTIAAAGNANPAELVLGSNDAANAVNFNGGNGRLTLQDGGSGVTLTVGTLMAIGAGSVFLSGSKAGGAVLNDAAGATISTGQILGTGIFNPALQATGAASLTVSGSGGPLEMGGAITDTGDALTLDLTAGNLILDAASAAHSITFGFGKTLEIKAAGSLAVKSQMTIFSAAVQLDGGAATLGDPGGIILNAGAIFGAGTVTGNLSGNGSVSATGGTMALTGTVKNDFNATTLTISTNTDTMLIGNTAAAQSVNFNNGQLEIGAAGSLTVTNAISIGTGTVKLDGGSAALTDIAGISLSTGSIIGAGKVDGNVPTSGAAQITASGGTLELTHPDGGAAAVFTITGNGDKLMLDFNGAAKTISFNGNSGTLNVHNQGGTNFTVTDQLAVGTGTLLLDTAQSKLTDAAGVSLGGGSIQGFDLVNANLTGFGAVTGAPTLATTVTASGGTLDLTSAVGGFTGLHIANGSGNVLQLDNSASAAAVVHFDGATGVFNLNSAPGVFAGSIDLHVGSDNVLAHNDAVQFGAKTVTAASLTNSTLLHVVTNGGTYDLTLTNAVNTGTTFADFTGSDVFLSTVPCFCRGTLLLTERGEVSVEQLTVGDRVVTLSGGLKPIVWIGMGRDLVTRRNSLARPIIVRQGALAEAIPARDLYLTHGHGLYLDGVLIPVENLINHRSILWDENARVVEYYHIELEDHDVLLANGAPAESYYDAGNRAQFHNTRPGSAAGEAKPTFAPVLNGGEAVERVWARLYQRAGGQLVAETTDDADLHLIVDGRRLNPAGVEEGIYSFAVVTPPAEGLSISSRSGVPSLVGVTAHDHRRLGVAISRIEISQPGTVTAIEHDAMLLLAGGSYAAEHGYAWTDGELALPTHLFAHLDGPFTIAVHTERPGMRYPREAEPAQAAA